MPVEKIDSPERVARLEFRICDLFAVGGPGQPPSERTHGRNMQYLFVAAIQICLEQAIFTCFRIVASDVGHPSAIGRKREGTIYIVDYRLWSTAQDRGSVNVEITGDGIFGFAEEDVVSVW